MRRFPLRQLSVLTLIAAMLLSLLQGYSPRAASAAAAAWQPDTAYAINDWVAYEGTEYQCIQAHTSAEGLEPSSAPDYWSANGKPIPGKVEAENWDAMNNVANEATSDTGGGLDVGNIKSGSWMDYKVNVAAAGTYQVEFRVATKYDGEKLQLKSADGTVLVEADVPNTTNWQKWATVVTQAELPEGPQTLRLTTSTGNFNVNWINFAFVASPSEPDPEPSPEPSESPESPDSLAIPGRIAAVDWTEMSGVRTEASDDPGSGTVVDYIDSGDWMDYALQVASEGFYTVSFRVASKNDGGSIQLLDSEGNPLTQASVPNTGNWSWWSTVSATVHLNAGAQTLRVYAAVGGFNLNWIEFASIAYSPTGLAATGGNALVTLGWTGLSGAASYNVKRALVSGGPYELIANVTTNAYEDTGLTNDTAYYYVVSAMTEYGESDDSAEAAATPAEGAALHDIPGKIDAVNWSAMNGVQAESSTDPGSGSDVGWIDDNDWMDYEVNATSAGIYSIDFRVASKNGGGQIQLRDSAGNVKGTVDVPSTGNWSWWTTINATAQLSAGAQTLRVYAVKGGFNLNWIEFAPKSYTPTGLFTIAGDGQATIGWASVTDAVSYNVKRSTVSGGPYEQVANVTEANYVDHDATNGTAYYYVVSAISEYGESPDSVQAAATPTAAALFVLSGTGSDGQAHLRWEPVQGADSYDLLRSDDGGASYHGIAAGLTATTYLDAGLTNHLAYRYVAAAKSAGASIGNSSPIPVSPVPPLASPTELAAVPGNSKVDLSWSPVEGAVSYSLKRSTVSGSGYTTLAGGLTSPSYSDATAVNGTTYYYVVSAVSDRTESMNSGQAVAAPESMQPDAPAAPGNVTVQAGTNKASLSWPSVEGADAYNVKRATSYAGPYAKIATVSDLAYTDAGLTNGTTYYYKVSALAASSEGASSQPAAATPAKVIVVSEDGTGDFTTIKGALDSIPSGNSTRQVIYIRNGVYREKIAIPSTKPFVSFVGESRDETIITYGDSLVPAGTSGSYTVLVSASDFSTESLTIQNEAFPRTSVGPAVALYTNADRALFRNVRIAGYQDTLYVNSGRQYYDDSIIEGDVDWIFGNANALFDRSEIKMVGNGGGYVTAASTDELSSYGLTFLNSKLTRGTSFLKNTVQWDSAWDIDNNPGATDSSADLGRPWRGYANVRYINTWMDSHITATAWSNWGNSANELTARYGEYNSSGPGANPAGRLKWTSQLTADEANSYTVQNLMRGTDQWDPTLFGTLPRGGQPPVAPSGLTAQYPNGAATSLGETSVQLTWDEAAGADSYHVYRSQTSGSGYELIESNLVPAPTPVLATIEAENWAAMSGVEAEDTTDEGGGQDVGHVDAGDWMDYTIEVPADGMYTIHIRVATKYDDKKLQLKSGDGTILATVDVPNTGNWQSWATVSAYVQLRSGSQTLRVFGLTGNTNINWFQLVQGLKGKVQFTDTILSSGASTYYVVTANNGNGESVYSNEASIANVVPTFDRNVEKRSDIAVSVNMPGKTVTGIAVEDYTLVPTTDYTVDGSTYTISQLFLMKLSVGTHTLTFRFDGGTTLPLVIQEVNTSPLPSQTIASVPDLKLYTIEGVKPYLPTIVPVLFTDGSEKALPVTWETIEPSAYASTGSFAIRGVVTGRDAAVQAIMQVEPTDSVVAVTGSDDLSSYLDNLPFAMSAIALPEFPDRDFTIADYGAVGDGTTLNTDAFAAAISAATSSGGGRVIVPAGTWLTGPIELKDNVNLHLEDGATILFHSDFDDYLLAKGVKNMLSGKGVRNVAVTGNGVIDGNGQNWRMVKKSKVTTTQWNYLLSLGGVLTDNGSVWYPSEEAVGIARPILVDFNDSDNVLVDGPTLVNGPVYLGSFTKVRNLVIRNTTANNAAWFQNGDGLDVSSSQNVVMYHNTVTAGDDAIGMKSSNSPSPTDTLSNAVVADNIVFRGHGGLSMGSNTAGGIQNLVIRNNQYIGTDGGLNIKTYVGNGGPISNIYFDGIHMTDIGGTAINVSDFYQGHDSVKDLAVLGVDSKVPEIKNIYISHVTVDGASTAVAIDALVNVPLTNVVFNEVTIVADNGWTSSNTSNIELNHVSITAKNGTLYTLTNADGFLFNDVLCPTGTGTFLHLSGTASQIRLQDTDYSHAGIPFHLDTGISSSVITISNPAALEAPAAPSAVNAMPGHTQVLLSWEPVSGAEEYIVKRRAAESEEYATLANEVADSFYLDAELAAGTYSYVVIAVNQAGESDDSEEVSAVVDAPSTRLPYAAVQGPNTVLAGHSFEWIVGLNNDNVTEGEGAAVYRQRLTIQYDPSLVRYEAVEPLVSGLTVSSVQLDESAGTATLLLDSAAGIVPGGDMVKLIWRSMGLDQAGDVGSTLRVHAAVALSGDGEEEELPLTVAAFRIQVDKSALQELIDQAQQLDSAGYSPDSWAVLQTYLTSARTAVADSSATPNQVNAAAANLQAAMELLSGVSDKSALETKIAIAEEAKNAAVIGTRWGQFESSAIARLEQAIARARLLLNDSNSGEAAVAQALVELEAAAHQFAESANPATVGDLAIVSARYGLKEDDADWSEYQIYDFNQDGRLDKADMTALVELILHS